MSARGPIARLAAAPAVLATVGLLSHALLGYVHLALVPHVHHGPDELHHLRASTAGTPNDTSICGPRAALTAPNAHQTDAQGCSVCTTLRQSSKTPQTPDWRADGPPAFDDSSRYVQHATARPLFPNAPKQSPPV